jgi:polysaccharide pyruvyl transferase WcaK-like protein
LKRIAIAGEIYSANVGDQAIHACLAYLLKKVDSSVEVISLDLSGRLRLAGPSNGMRPRQRIALLQSNPGLQPFFPALNVAYDLVRKRKRLAAWEPALSSVDLLVIGGGQLLMDDGLNFPLKLASLVEAAQAQGVPYTITACGVGKPWSAAARSLFRPILAGAKAITVRDPLSLERLEGFIPGISSQVTFDPTIWAAAVYPFPGARLESETIGLGVINLSEVNVHLERSQRISNDRWQELWTNLLDNLLRTNHAVELFTTGSPADREFAEKLLITAHARNWKRVTIAPQPANPEALISALQKYSLVVAARLHAALLANASGISSIGLAWDHKVKAYYGLTRRPELCFDMASLPPAGVAQACAAICGQPFPAVEIEEFRTYSIKDAGIVLAAI